MTRLVARLVLAMLMPPVALVVVSAAHVSAFALAPVDSEVLYCGLASLGGFLVMATYWTLVWRGVVRWSRRRVVMTGIAVAASLGCGVVVYASLLWVMGSSYYNYRDQYPLWFGGLTPPLAFAVLATLVWRETPTERAERHAATGADALVCPACGYSMVGQREATCPECGARFTLDALVAAQRHNETKRFEQG